MTEVLVRKEKCPVLKGWRKARLGDLATVQTGGTPSVANKTFWGGDIPFYSSGELNSLYTDEAERTITAQGLASSNAKVFPKGSLVIGMYDTAALKTSILNRDAAFNQAIAGVKPNSEVDLGIVLHQIAWKRDELLRQRRGVRQKNLNLSKIRDIQLTLPALLEQKRIVAILDEAFADIAKAKANAEKNLGNARDFYRSSARELFSFPESDEVPLGRVCQLRGGGTPAKNVAEYWNGDIPWVSPKDVKIDLVCDSIDHISAKAIEESSTSLLPKRSILIVVRSGILARTVPLALTGRELTINQDLKALIPHESVRPDFLFHLLKSREDELLAFVSKGATVHRLPSDRLRSLGIAVPSSEKQRRAVESVLELRTHAVRLHSIYQQKLTALEELKQSLLHQAFTGQL